ncbi:MAG: two-component system sensor histidine kinase AlgZ [Candidatus Azotimanducaceae bacterium]
MIAQLIKSASSSARLDVPDLLVPRMLFFLVVTGLLLGLFGWALSIEMTWHHFIYTSLFALWVVLVFSIALHFLRPFFARTPIFYSVICVFLVGIAATAGVHILMNMVFSNEPSPEYLLPRRLAIVILCIGAYLRYTVLRQRLIRQEESELHSKIQALQSRIRPHFLFNSMNIIASLIPSDPETAEQVVEDLSELFRASLQEEGSFVRLEDELDLCQRYVRIEGLRLGERLVMNWAISEAKELAKIPLLLIQPLLENAIYHGVQPIPEGGTIDFTLEYIGEEMLVTISNPVPQFDSIYGSDDHMARNDSKSVGKSNNLAIANIRTRLEVLYGPKAQLTTSLQGNTFLTKLRCPKVPLAQ